jgi:hypothetical protein
VSSSIDEWWNRPIRTRDRILGFFVGLIGGFVAGALGRLFLGSPSFQLTELAWWAFGSMVLCSILGVLFPKLVTLVLYPFASISIGSS